MSLVAQAFVVVVGAIAGVNGGEQDGDIISINRFDGNNPYRGNDYITMRKEGNYATTIQFRATFGTAKARYYSMTMRLSSDDLPSQAEVFRLYGYASYDDTYRNINQVIMTLDNDGNLVTYTGVKVLLQMDNLWGVLHNKRRAILLAFFMYMHFL